MSSKIEMWGTSYHKDGIQLYVAVEANGRVMATKKFAEAGFPIIQPDKLQEIVIMKSPGPRQVQKMKTMEFESNVRPCEDSKDG